MIESQDRLDVTVHNLSAEISALSQEITAAITLGSEARLVRIIQDLDGFINCFQTLHRRAERAVDEWRAQRNPIQRQRR